MFYGSAGLQDIHVVGIKDGIDHLMETASLYESNSTPPRPQEDFITKTKHQTLSSYYFITSISSLILTNEIFFS